MEDKVDQIINMICDLIQKELDREETKDYEVIFKMLDALTGLVSARATIIKYKLYD